MTYLTTLPQAFPHVLNLPADTVKKLVGMLMDVDSRPDTKLGTSFAVTTEHAGIAGRWSLWLSTSSYRYLTDAVDIFE
jgi:hypothetical protein